MHVVENEKARKTVAAHVQQEKLQSELASKFPSGVFESRCCFDLCLHASDNDFKIFPVQLHTLKQHLLFNAAWRALRGKYCTYISGTEEALCSHSQTNNWNIFQLIRF